MAHTKSGTTTGLGRNSAGQRLGIKLSGGSKAKIGSIIVRQNGFKYRPGLNVKTGKDYTIFSMVNGIVRFSKKRFQYTLRTVVNIDPYQTQN